MSKVLMKRVFAKDTYPVSAAAVAASWLPGQFFGLNSLGQAIIGVVDGSLFLGVDGPTELAAPPTGSLLTVAYGIGSKIAISHAAEVAAGSATRAYDSSCESASVGADLYVGTTGKLQSTPATGSVKAKLLQVPSADNSYTIQFLLRI